MDDVFARIVCGADGSPAALAAVRQATRLATPDSSMLLISVSERQLAAHAGLLAGRAAEQIEDEAEKALADVARIAPGAASRIVHGRATDALLQAVEEEKATLVAVGSHEISRGKGMLLGSVATRLVHDASCSVLLAREIPEPDAFPRSIVVGADGSSASLDAARVAHDLGARLGATVTLVAATGGGAEDFDDEALGASGLEVERRKAKPVDALLEASENADLVVIGSRGVRGLRTLGSVSERVAHSATCSVLVVRTPSE